MRVLNHHEIWKRGHGILSLEEALPARESIPEVEFWKTLAKCLQFRKVWRQKIQVPRHVNIGEARVHLKAESEAAVLRRRSEVIIGSDFQVTAVNVAKGSSSSRCVNFEYQGGLWPALGGGIFF